MADANFELGRVLCARFATFGRAALLRVRFRGALQLQDSIVALRLPRVAASDAGEQTGLAVIESEDGLCFAQTRVAAGSDVLEIEQPALQANQLYTISLQMILEI